MQMHEHLRREILQLIEKSTQSDFTRMGCLYKSSQTSASASSSSSSKQFKKRYFVLTTFSMILYYTDNKAFLKNKIGNCHGIIPVSRCVVGEGEVYIKGNKK